MNVLKMPLNPLQLEILKLFSKPMSHDELLELRQVLVKHLAGKLSQNINTSSAEKGYTQQDFDSWLEDSGQ